MSRTSILSVTLSVGMAMTPAMAQAATSAGAWADAAADATAEPTTDPRVRRLQQMYADAQAKVQSYNESRELNELTAARDLLSKWLTDHRALYGDTQAALDVRAPVQQQLDTIDAQITELTAPPPPQPMPAPAAATQPPPADNPPPPSQPQEGRGLVNGGTALVVLGGASMLGVALPLWATRNQAINRSNSREFRANEDRDLEKAQRRHVGMITMFAVGGSLAAAGIAMLTAGMVKRSKARRTAVAPHVGPGFAGASATVRF